MRASNHEVYENRLRYCSQPHRNGSSNLQFRPVVTMCTKAGWLPVWKTIEMRTAARTGTFVAS